MCIYIQLNPIILGIFSKFLQHPYIKFVEKSDDIKMEEVAEAAGFMKPSQIDEAVDNASKKLFDIDTLVMLAPHLSSDRLAELIEK